MFEIAQSHKNQNKVLIILELFPKANALCHLVYLFPFAPVVSSTASKEKKDGHCLAVEKDASVVFSHKLIHPD